jgi:hypothetical protein
MPEQMSRIRPYARLLRVKLVTGHTRQPLPFSAVTVANARSIRLRASGTL